jgi:pSer/pThr/pTyr-binding forkhead associated (FHA) protein
MSEAVVALPKTQILELAEKILGDRALTASLEKALQHLHDDEYELLPLEEKRAFWGEAIRKELARAGVSKGQLAMSGLTAAETPTSVALVQIEQLDPKCAEAARAALARLRTVVIDCTSCENLTLPRFKSEDDRCRSCGELLPVSPSYGSVEDAAQVAALLEQDPTAVSAGLGAEGSAASADLGPDTSPASWEIVAAKPDVARFLKLSPENLDWDEVLAARQRVVDEARRKLEEEAAKKKAEAEALARKKAEEEAAKKKAEAEVLARKKAEEEAAKKKAEADALARKKAEAEALARKQAEEEARKKAEAEALARKQTEEEAARKKAEAEALARKKAEEDARRKEAEALAAVARAQEEARRKEAEALAAVAKAQADARAKEEEDERRRKAEQSRPAIGVLTGEKAGQQVRIDDLDPKLKPSGKRPLVVITGGKAKVLVPSSTKTWINEKPVSGGIFDLAPGDLVRGIFEDEDLCLIEETGELKGVNADPLHLKRDDGELGGPWNYWNETLRIGSNSASEVFIVDDGVDDSHAVVNTRFGRVVIEDTCKREDGVWVEGARVRSLVAKPGMKIKLGSRGPVLAVVEGHAEVKEAPAAAGPMKPARYVRTCLHVQTTTGERQKVFLLARREVRFGKLFSASEGKVDNDLIITPADDLQTVADKQGSLSLTRDGVSVRCDDRRIPMSVDDHELGPGQSVVLKREFTIEIGIGLVLEGQVYRAPAGAKRADGPPALGIEGGHPNECVKLVREGDDSGHTYVFLVRQIRLGSGQNDSIRLPGNGVAPGHAVIQLSRGVLQIVAPREKNKVKVDGVPLRTGVPYPLKLGAKILLGECLIRFEVCQESDFKIQAAAVT